MRILLAAFLVAALSGCNVNPQKIKLKTQQNVKAGSNQMKEQTGEDLGSVKQQKTKFGVPRPGSLNP